MRKESAYIIPIIGALVVAIAPHTPGLPLWINCWCVAMWGYMLIGLKTKWPMPGNYIRYGLTFTGIAGLMLTDSVGIGGDAFIGLLALMAAIKPFEMATHRHRMITLLLTYFIIITSLFRSESMFIVLYMFFSVFVTTAALIHINAPGSRLKESMKLSGIILAQAIPIMVLLFLLFPRLPGSLFGFEDKSQGRTGFSDRLSPGSISRLVQDHTPAFRAEFSGRLPTADQLYWRGIVFEKFDGKTWTTLDQVLPNPPQIVSRGKYYTYTILLEPHNSPWLMALDLPVKGPQWADITRGQALKSRRPVKHKIRYKATSIVIDTFDAAEYTDAGRTGAGAGGINPGVSHLVPAQASPEEMAASIISTTKNKNPRARALAVTIGGKAFSTTKKIDLLLAYFKNNQFIYTLNPPIAGRHPIDNFLFESRKGYCEHYASAFGFMMNVLGVPARLVGGYLGGEHNPYGNYLTIRRSYAHVWVEIFDPKTGWVRVDPTISMAPDRMETNPDGSMASFGSSAGALSFSQKLKFALDAANLRWEAWFTGYSYFEQRAFLEKLGLDKWGGFMGTTMVLILLALLILTGFSGFIFWLFQSKRTEDDPVKQAYDLFCHRLDKIGLTRRPGHGPIDFAEICGKKRPDLQSEIIAITNFYVQLRFRKNCPDSTLANLKTRIKHFKPKPSEDSFH